MNARAYSPFLRIFTICVLVGISQPIYAFELVNPLSLIKGAVEAAAEDRSADDIKNDATIKTKIVSDVINKMGSDVISINADVYEQIVMLTGVVEKQEQKKQAAKLAQKVEGVRKIYNEIIVQKPLKEDKGAVENFVDDAVIETKINGLLLDAKGINVTNFRWRSVRGHVFLFGRALSAAERVKAVQITKGIKGVSKVTSHTFVRPKKK